MADGRWSALFDDLDAQAEALDRAQTAAEAQDRARAEFGDVTLLHRLPAQLGRRLRVTCAGSDPVIGELQRVGPDWLLLRTESGAEVVVLGSAVLAIAGVGRRSHPGAVTGVAARLTVRSVLRGIVRDRSGVVVHMIDATVLTGTLDRVAADFVELAVHPQGEPRRAGTVSDVVLIRLAAMGVVRRLG